MDIQGSIVLAAVFLANIVEGVTGFAGTMLAMPVAMKIVGIADARIALNMVALFMSGSIMMENFRDVRWKEVVKISVLMLMGALLGLYLLKVIPISHLSVLYGVFIVAVALNGLLGKRKIRLPRWTLAATILAAGVIHGMFLSGGALLVVYAIIALKDKSVIRATLAPVWIILNVFLLIQGMTFTVFSFRLLKLGLLCIPAAAFALLLGNQLHKKIPETIFIKLTYALLILSGLFLLI